MKKKVQVIETKPGWTGLVGYIGACHGCKERLKPPTPCYWRKVNGVSVVYCRGCADK